VDDLCFLNVNDAVNVDESIMIIFKIEKD